MSRCFQYLIVAVIVVYAIYRIIKHLRKSNQSPCDSCSLGSTCHKSPKRCNHPK